MSKKTSVGIWTHYRTTERPAADGLQFSGCVAGIYVRAKLYWAPADFTKGTKGKAPYLVLRVGGEMNTYGDYEGDIRESWYVGEERPRRNWNELCQIAEKLGEDKLGSIVDGILAVHYERLELGFDHSRSGFYNLPQFESEDAKRAAFERVSKAFDLARKPGPLKGAAGTPDPRYGLAKATNLAKGMTSLTDPEMFEAASTDLRRIVRDAIVEAGDNATFERIETVAGQVLASVTAKAVEPANEPIGGMLRAWYVTNYPSDSLGQEVDPEASFIGLYETLKDGRDVYEYIGVGDSVLRERFFERLAALMGRDYDYVYDWWLHHAA